MESNRISNKIETLIDSKTRQQSIGKLVMAQEIVDHNVAEAFLTAVGIETGKRDETNAQAMARKIIRSHTPGELKKSFNNDESGYTRTDINDMYLEYLVKCCGVDLFTAFGSSEDDQLWYAFFPDTKHTCQPMRDLPQLTGEVEVKFEAESIRRNKLTELFLLGDLCGMLSTYSSECFIEDSNHDVPENSVKLFGETQIYIWGVHKALSDNRSAEKWLAQKNIKYDIEWIKIEKNLAFLEPSCVRFTKEGITQMAFQRQLLFNLTSFTL